MNLKTIKKQVIERLESRHSKGELKIKFSSSHDSYPRRFVVSLVPEAGTDEDKVITDWVVFLLRQRAFDYAQKNGVASRDEKTEYAVRPHAHKLDSRNKEIPLYAEVKNKDGSDASMIFNPKYIKGKKYFFYSYPESAELTWGISPDSTSTNIIIWSDLNCPVPPKVLITEKVLETA